MNYHYWKWLRIIFLRMGIYCADWGGPHELVEVVCGSVTHPVEDRDTHLLSETFVVGPLVGQTRDAHIDDYISFKFECSVNLGS